MTGRGAGPETEASGLGVERTGSASIPAHDRVGDVVGAGGGLARLGADQLRDQAERGQLVAGVVAGGLALEPRLHGDEPILRELAVGVEHQLEVRRGGGVACFVSGHETSFSGPSAALRTLRTSSA